MEKQSEAAGEAPVLGTRGLKSDTEPLGQEVSPLMNMQRSSRDINIGLRQMSTLLLLAVGGGRVKAREGREGEGCVAERVIILIRFS